MTGMKSSRPFQYDFHARWKWKQLLYLINYRSTADTLLVLLESGVSMDIAQGYLHDAGSVLSSVPNVKPSF